MNNPREEPSDLAALREVADDIFGTATEDVLDVQQVSIDFDPTLWRTLEGSGLTLLTTPDTEGGSAASLYALAVVLESCGYHGAPAPIAETDLLASWMLRSVGLPVPSGPLSCASADVVVNGSRVTGEITHVPWISSAAGLVIAGSGVVAYIPALDLSVTTQHDIGGHPSGRVVLNHTLPKEQIREQTSELKTEFWLRGALARSLQTCGALQRALDLSVTHAGERVQFGRPLGRFQAVQGLIAEAAGSVAMAKAASEYAVDTAARNGFEAAETKCAIAAAKIEAARAATTVSRNSHQVHGAIGFTLDHRLRHFTTHALAWRSEFGGQRAWERILGNMVLDSGTNGIWEFITSGRISADDKEGVDYESVSRS